jgi:hypothetical protein
MLAPACTAAAGTSAPFSQPDNGRIARAPPSPRCTALTAASCENHGAAPNFGTRVPGIFGGNRGFRALLFQVFPSKEFFLKKQNTKHKQTKSFVVPLYFASDGTLGQQRCQLRFDHNDGQECVVNARFPTAHAPVCCNYAAEANERGRALARGAILLPSGAAEPGHHVPNLCTLIYPHRQ